MELEFSSTDDGTRIMAQVFSSETQEMPRLAWAELDGKCLGEVPVPEHGMFSLELEQRGPIDVVLDLGDHRLRLPLGQPDAD